MIRRPPESTLFPYTPLSRSSGPQLRQLALGQLRVAPVQRVGHDETQHGVAEELQALVGRQPAVLVGVRPVCQGTFEEVRVRSEEHTSELQSRQYLVCRLLLE